MLLYGYSWSAVEVNTLEGVPRGSRISVTEVELTRSSEQERPDAVETMDLVRRKTIGDVDPVDVSSGVDVGSNDIRLARADGSFGIHWLL